MSDGPPGGTPPPPEQPGWVPPPGQPAPGPPPAAQPGWGQPPPGQPPPGQPGGWGQPPPPQYYGQYPAAPRTEGTAVAALICAIAAFVVCPLIPAIVALPLASTARKKIAASGGQLGGDNLAQVATIVAWVNIGLVAVGIALIVILAIAGAFNDDNTTTFDSLGLLVNQLPLR